MKSTIKTIIIVVLAMLVVFTTTFTILTFSLIGCSNMTELRELIARDVLIRDLDNTQTEGTQEEEKKPDTSVVTPPVTNNNPVTDNKDTSKVETETNKPEPEKDPFEGIEPLCIWNMNGIKITVLGLEMNGFYGPEMYIEIENNTSNNLLFGIEDVSVNGYMMDPYWATSVAAGKKARETIYWFEESCIENGIEDIHRVECVFHISDDDTWTTIIETPTIGIDFE